MSSNAVRKATTPVGYRFSGGKGAKSSTTERPTPTFSLTKEEALMEAKTEQLLEKIREGERALAELKLIRKDCQHTVFNDEAGFPYDSRSCHICKDFLYEL